MTLSAHSAEQPPRWTRVWLALLPVLPFLSPAAVVGIRELYRFDRTIRLVLAVYVVTQLVAALLTPQPLLALGTATVRVVLIGGLLGLGARWQSVSLLHVLGVGLGVVYGSALISAFDLRGSALLDVRLSHPYYTAISLGIAGAFGVWIALNARAWRMFVRLALGLSGLLVLLLSGSRGPLLLLLLGTVVLIALRSRWSLIAGTLAGFVIVLTLFTTFQLTPLLRFVTVDTTGRDTIWGDVASVMHAYPIGGVGAYQLGPLITPPSVGCALFDALAARGVQCPALFSAVENFWVIAHNGFLHQAGESGVLGTVGLYLLLGCIVRSAWNRRDPLMLAVILGLLTADLTDNVLIVPSPFFAEVFWLLSGMALAGTPARSFTGPIVIATLLMGLSAFPLWADPRAPVLNGDVRLVALEAARQWRFDEPYNVRGTLTLPDGNYRVQLRMCANTCRTLVVKAVSGRTSGTTPVTLTAGLPATRAPLTLQFRLLRGQSAPWQVRPLAQSTWLVSPVEP